MGVREWRGCHFYAQHLLLLGGECCLWNLEQPLCCSVLLQRSQGFKPQSQGKVAQGHLSPLPGLMLPAVNHYPLARMCFQNICSRECLARSDLEKDRQYWLGEWRNNEKLPLLCFMLFNEHKIEYLLIQSSTEWAGTLKAAIVASKSLYKHGT